LRAGASTDGYTDPVTVKEQLHRIIDGLSDEDAEELLDYLTMRANPDTFTPEDLARVKAADAEIARSEYVTLED
jgi:coproporphyrinogen III oxidase-like Fe-S oxidoreductase